MEVNQKPIDSTKKMEESKYSPENNIQNSNLSIQNQGHNVQEYKPDSELKHNIQNKYEVLENLSQELVKKNSQDNLKEQQSVNNSKNNLLLNNQNDQIIKQNDFKNQDNYTSNKTDTLSIKNEAQTQNQKEVQMKNTEKYNKTQAISSKTEDLKHTNQEPLLNEANQSKEKMMESNQKNNVIQQLQNCNKENIDGIENKYNSNNQKKLNQDLEITEQVNNQQNLLNKIENKNLNETSKEKQNEYQNGQQIKEYSKNQKQQDQIKNNVDKENASNTSCEIEIQSLSQVLPQQNQLKTSPNKKFIPKKIALGQIQNENTNISLKNDQLSSARVRNITNHTYNPQILPINLEEKKQRVTSIYSSQLTQKTKMNSNRSHHQKYIQKKLTSRNTVNQDLSTNNLVDQTIQENTPQNKELKNQNQNKLKLQNQLSEQSNQQGKQQSIYNHNNNEKSKQKIITQNKHSQKMNQSKQSQVSLQEAQSIILKNGQVPFKMNSRIQSQQSIMENKVSIKAKQKQDKKKMESDQELIIIQQNDKELQKQIGEYQKQQSSAKKSQQSNQQSPIKNLQTETSVQGSNQKQSVLLQQVSNRQSGNKYMENTEISVINKKQNLDSHFQTDNEFQAQQIDKLKPKYNHHVDIDLSKVEQNEIDEEIEDITKKNNIKQNKLNIDASSPKSQLNQRRTFYKDSKQQEPLIETQLHQQIQNSSEIHRQNKKDLQKMIQLQSGQLIEDKIDIPLTNQAINEANKQSIQQKNKNKRNNHTNSVMDSSNISYENQYQPKFKKKLPSQKYLEDQNQVNHTQRSQNNQFNELKYKLKRQRNNHSVHNMSQQISGLHNRSMQDNRLNYSVNHKIGVHDVSQMSQQRKNFCDVIMEQRKSFNQSRNNKSSQKLKLASKLKSPQHQSKMESVNSSKNIEFKVNKHGPKSKRSNIFQQQQFSLKNNPLYQQTPSYQNLFKEIVENTSIKHLKQIISPDLLKNQKNLTPLKIIPQRKTTNQSVDYHNISRIKHNQSRLDTSQSQAQVKDFMKVILKQKQQYELNRSVSNDKSMNMSINKLKLNSTMNKSKETLKNNLPSKVLDNSILKDVNRVQNPRQNQSIQSNYEKKFNQKQHSTSNIKQYSKLVLQQNDLLSPSQQLPRKRIYSEHVGSKQILNNLIKKNQVRSQKKDNIQNNENHHPYLLDSQQYQQQSQKFRLQQKQFQQTPSKGNIHTSKIQKYSLQNSKMHSGLQTPKYNKLLAPINSSKPQSTKQYYRLDQARSQSIQYNPRPVNQSSSAYKADSVYNPHNIPSKREYYLKIKKKVHNLSFQQHEIYNPQSDNNSSFSNQHKKLKNQQNYESDSNANRQKKYNKYKNSVNNNLVNIQANRYKEQQQKYQNQASKYQDGQNYYTFQQYQNQSKSKSRFPVIDSTKNKRSISSNLNIILNQN